ncbi:hypothetical protein D3Z51_12890 [Clostridiaceae bacterium]|nr:hypothetical protein [Clostridiaceae bacterium]RKI12036.1 hypothetical protein D7V81_12645 [bacterium 1XD21-70]
MENSMINRLFSLPEKGTDRILFACGIFLAATELYKQLFLFYFINSRHYDWWFFPFQLCSLPLYLCLMVPFLPSGRLKKAFCTFMQDYNLLGGIAALAVPDGFCHIHWTLTLHGYLWHCLLVLIGLLLLTSGRSDLSRRGFTDTIPWFFVFCGIATAVNVLAPGHGRADMFYISPYAPSSQPVFHGLSLRLGIWPANLLYLLTILAGAALIHFSAAAAIHLRRSRLA